jgi:membrane-bound serine protease (ClpP class)
VLRVSLALMALGWLLLAVAGARGAGPEIVVLPTTGVVDSAMAKYLDDQITQAEGRQVAAVIIKLNTPGGYLSDTNDIVGTILEAKVPVIVWVAPAGGYAASAGTFITLAGNIALMAPGTTIGAATPILSTGEDIPEDLRKKVLNDAIDKISEIATVRERNVEWAASTVRDARSSGATEAVAEGAVDGIASTLEEVIAFADGKIVKLVGGQSVTLELTGATTTEEGMNLFLALFRILANPDLALFLFSTGSIGILAELYSPNFVTGILGALMIILGLIGLGTLPLNVGGLLLIAFGLVLFGLEVTVTSHGLLGVGGLACFVIGASALFTGPVDPFAPLIRVAPLTIIVVSVTLGSIMALVVFGALRSRRIGVVVPAGDAGGQAVVGELGEVRSPLSPVGSVIAGGEEWTARTADGSSLERGTLVRVINVEGLTLTVEPDASSSKGT